MFVGCARKKKKRKKKDKGVDVEVDRMDNNRRERSI